MTDSRRDYTFAITDIAEVQIDNFKFSTRADGNLCLNLIEADDPVTFVRGPRTIQPWEKRGDTSFKVALGTYTLSGDDKTSPCTVEVNAEPTFVVLDGTDVYFVGLPGPSFECHSRSKIWTKPPDTRND
jgi:hypothetical protein